MGILASKVFGKLFGKKDVRILMVGLDAAGKARPPRAQPARRRAHL